ncbi:alpha/beta hydrolase fold domain-containing protein [Yinghuangia aomiensis]
MAGISRIPTISPLFGDLTGFPPTFLMSGTRDLFLSNTVRMHRRLRTAGRRRRTSHRRGDAPRQVRRRRPEDLEITAELNRFLTKHRR